MVIVTTTDIGEMAFPSADRWRLQDGGVLEVLAEGTPVGIFPPDGWAAAVVEPAPAIA